MVQVVGNPATLSNLNVAPVILVDLTGAYVGPGSGTGGDASAANQTTGNTSLASIDVKLTTTNALLGADRTYEAVAASQSLQVMGSTGAIGDQLDTLLVVPANLNPGAISIKDGSGTAITVFTGGTGSITSLTPFSIFFDSMKSTSGAWQITTGASLSLIATGKFT